MGVEGRGDDFVALAHHEPAAAERWLAGDRRLAVVSSTWGESPVDAAAHCGHRRLLYRLLEAGARCDLFAACATGDVRLTLAKLRRRSGEPLGVHQLPLLHFAIANGDLAMLRALLLEGVATNPIGAALSPLHSAVARGDGVMASLLLAAGADPMAPDAFGDSALDWAASSDARDRRMFALLSQTRGLAEVTSS